MIVHCILCGEELTAPQFFEGKPYCWFCIKKVAPKAKKNNVIGFENFTLIRSIVGREHIRRCIIEYKGKHFVVTGEIHCDTLWVSQSQLKKLGIK